MQEKVSENMNLLAMSSHISFYSFRFFLFLSMILIKLFLGENMLEHATRYCATLIVAKFFDLTGHQMIQFLNNEQTCANINKTMRINYECNYIDYLIS